MLQIKPFKATVYSKDVKLNLVVAPPYDVIDEKKRRQLCSHSKYNITHIILPEGKNKYEHAKNLLEEWIHKNILLKENTDALYIYEQIFNWEGKQEILKGFVGALQLEKWGKNIYPHEKTLSGPKIDRFNLITQTRTFFSPVLALYEDDKNIERVLSLYDKRKPDICAHYTQDVHKIWKIVEKENIDIVCSAMKNKKIIIADGHHRYETALNIKRIYPLCNHIPAMFMGMEKSGLLLLPIHRLVKGTKENFLKKLSQYFNIEKTPTKNSEIVMYDGRDYYNLNAKVKRNKPLPIFFDHIIYRKILGLIEKDMKKQESIGYAHSTAEAIKMVNDKKARYAFLLKAISYKELIDIVRKNIVLPQKSTFFYPKVLSGLVMLTFGD